MQWYKGTLHCHTNHSDGLAKPFQVGHFYRIQGHDFLGVSDHNRYTPTELYAASSGLLGVPCCEYSDYMSCHVLSIGVTEDLRPGPRDGATKYIPHELLQEGIDKTLAAGGLPVVCHPLWNWAVDADDMLQLKNCHHFEVCNAGPSCNAFPIPGYEPIDELWDRLLSAGHRYYGLANDDAHEYFYPPILRADMGGIGYNVVRIPELTVEHVIEAIRHGRFYASSGIHLAEYRVTGNGITIKLQQQQKERTVFQFFGHGGRELKKVVGQEADYTFNGDENYVRIRIASTAGLWAWTQPVFLDDLADAINWTK